MNLCVIGLGLIGGSLALDLKKRGFANHVFGVENNPENAAKALELGIVDDIVSLEMGCKLADLIVVATPVNIAAKILYGILELTDKQVVTDVCSTKHSLVKTAAFSLKRKNYVAAHPMAGTEHSGPEAAIYDLFDGKAAIICDGEQSSPEALATVKKMFEMLHMPITHMEAKSHDLHAAYVSHISHISSFALALTVLEKEKDEKSIFNMASGGFESTVRLAKSAASMWAPIFNQNKSNLIEVIDTYIDNMLDFRKYISENNTEALSQMMEEANKITEVLNQKKKAQTESLKLA